MLPVDASVTVLMPVHGGVAGEHFAEAVDSLLDQTRCPNEIVIVEDGALSDHHGRVLDRLEQAHPRVVRIKIPTNQGAGVANQAGLEAASGAWIAKADADDINVPARIATQLDCVIADGVELCGAAMLEFADKVDNIVSVRTMPSTSQEIGRRMRWNNPINHPTAFFCRRSALEAGGYPAWRNMQDYGLFARMYVGGARMKNLDEPLVLFRAAAGVIKRRRSATIRRLEWDLQRELRSLGVVSGPQMVSNLLWRTAFRSMPPAVVRLVSRRVLAQPNVGSRDQIG